METYFLANKGLLNAKLIPGFESLGRFLTREDVSAFSAKYVVLTRTIAKDLDTDRSYIVAVLGNKNIHPISGRTIDGGLQYVFRQADLVNLDLRELISNYRATDHSTVPTCSLDLKEVCSALGVDEDSAHRMVQNGFLRSSIRYRRPSTRNRYFLQPELVDECRRRKLPFASLLSIYIAAKRVGIVLSTLRKAILRGALPAIQSEKHLHCFYVVEEDVDAFVEKHGNSVGAKAAAEILQVTKGVFNRLVKKGVLKRASGPNVDGYGRSRYLRTDVERVRASLRLKDPH